MIPQLYLAATQKSSGKTTISIGLTAELTRRGQVVQPFKKGPDYIDPMWLRLAAGRDCFNLDYHCMSRAEIERSVDNYAHGADLCLVEGNVGLFDSIDVNGAGSNAELVKTLQMPLVLVVDVKGMGRGIAPLLLGYQAFDPQLQIAGVILNKVGGGRHGTNLVRVVEHYTDLPVLGLLPRDEAMEITERHLGLIPSIEQDNARDQLEQIRMQIATHVDVDAICELAHAGARPSAALPPVPALPPTTVRIGIAQDRAFGFYYPDDLMALRRLGAELVPFSPIDDTALPAVDALLLGGGFPEYHMTALAANQPMRAAVAAFIASGGPAYAECGGLMYLCRTLEWGEHRQPMCGLLNATVRMYPQPQGRGYVRLTETKDFPWSTKSTQPEVVAHEFHHSALIDPDPAWRYAYQVQRGHGIDGKNDGIVYKNLLASYAHLRSVGNDPWTTRFVAHIQHCLD